MKVLCLGAAGKISRESVFDLVEFSDFQKFLKSWKNVTYLSTKRSAKFRQHLKWALW